MRGFKRLEKVSRMSSNQPTQLFTSQEASSIRDALRHELSWTHYRNLLRVENEQARNCFVLHENEQLFASKYKLVLPSEDELRAELEREQLWLAEQKEIKKKNVL